MADAVKLEFVTAEMERIIVDNDEAVFVDSKWNKKHVPCGILWKRLLFHCAGWGREFKTASATWLPKIENSGYYNVYVQHPEGGGDGTISDNAPYTITHASGETIVRLNQREKGKGGQWRKLGHFRLMQKAGFHTVEL